MKKLIKNEICGSMNSTRMYCSQKTGQMLRLLFMYRTWTVAASGEKTREKKKRKKKKEKENAAAETQEMRTQTHTYNHCQSAAHNHINHHKSYLDAHQRRIHSTPPKPHGQHLPHGVCMREMNKKVINFFIIKSYPKFRLVMIF